MNVKGRLRELSEIRPSSSQREPTFKWRILLGLGVLSLSGVAVSQAQTLSVTFIEEFAYNPPRQWIPPDEDKAGYWREEDFGVLQLMDLDLPSGTIAVVTDRRQPDEWRLITLDVDRRAVAQNRVATDEYRASIEDMALSPDGSRIAMTDGEAARFRIWRISDGSLIGTGATDGTVNALSWSQDGSRLAVADKTSIEMWTAEPPLERQKFIRGVRSTSPAAWIMDVAWSPDGNFLAIGTNEPAVYINDLTTGRQGAGLRPKPVGAVTQLEWSPDGEYLAMRVQGNNGEISIWHQPKKAATSPPGTQGYSHVAQLPAADNGQDLGPLAIDPSSRTIVFSNKLGELLFHDLETGGRIETQQGHGGAVRGLAWEGDTLLSYGLYPDRKFKLWRVERTN